MGKTITGRIGNVRILAFLRAASSYPQPEKGKIMAHLFNRYEPVKNLAEEVERQLNSEISRGIFGVSGRQGNQKDGYYFEAIPSANFTYEEAVAAALLASVQFKDGGWPNAVKAINGEMITFRLAVS